MKCKIEDIYSIKQGPQGPKKLKLTTHNFNPQVMASLSNYSFQNRQERPNVSKNNSRQAKCDIVSERWSESVTSI